MLFLGDQRSLGVEEEDFLKVFQDCRKGALAKWRLDASGDRKVLEGSIGACREKFPAAEVYIQCKKKALVEQKGTPTPEDIQQCARKAKAASIATSAIIPLFKNRQNELVFAGINFTQPLPLANGTSQDFNCDRVKNYGKRGVVPEYLGFGNSLGTFEAFKSLSSKKVQELLGESFKAPNGKKGKRSPRPERFKDVRGFARLTGIPFTSHTSVLFPVGYCFAVRKLDEKYDEMKVYFLVDPVKSVAYPYLGVAFYDPRTKSTRDRVAAAVGKVLGPDFLEQQAPKGGKIIFAKSKIAQFDEEGDPFDVCENPKHDEYLGILKESLQRKGLGEFFLVANIRNLCQYGELISKRFVASKR